MGQGKDELADSPARIREAIAQARADLGARLSALLNSQFPSGGDGPGDETMPTRPKTKTTTTTTKRSAAKGEAKAVKAKAAAKPKAQSSKKSAPARIVEGVAAKAGHVLDTMAAGAVVGAVKAAAESISEDEAKSPKGKRKSSPSTGQVLSGMASDAAVGAIAGAAHAVLPDAVAPEVKGPKPEAAKPKAAKGRAGGRKSV